MEQNVTNNLTLWPDGSVSQTLAFTFIMFNAETRPRRGARGDRNPDSNPWSVTEIRDYARPSYRKPHSLSPSQWSRIYAFWCRLTFTLIEMGKVSGRYLHATTFLDLASANENLTTLLLFVRACVRVRVCVGEGVCASGKRRWCYYDYRCPVQCKSVLVYISA